MTDVRRAASFLALALLALLLLVGLGGCATFRAPRGWHFEHTWTPGVQMPWERAGESGRFVTCIVNDTTGARRDCR